MAQWKETLEPYVKVQERVKTATLNPTAGEDLIIGVAFISDAGPSTPTLITSQSEFLSTYASKDLDQEYIESLNDLYNVDNSDLAATMWSNAYRLAGSNSLLCVRASKGDNLYFTKPLTTETTQDTYILKDGELLKKINSFRFCVDKIGDESTTLSGVDGWIINISGIGIFGNRVTNDGAQYDYYCQNLADLVKQLNDTSMFFSPDYKFYNNQGVEMEIDMDDVSSYGPYDIAEVEFISVFIGVEIIDVNDSRTSYPNLEEVDEYSGDDIIRKNSFDDIRTAVYNTTLKEGQVIYYSCLPYGPVVGIPTRVDWTTATFTIIVPTITWNIEESTEVSELPETPNEGVTYKLDSNYYSYLTDTWYVYYKEEYTLPNVPDDNTKYTSAEIDWIFTDKWYSSVDNLQNGTKDIIASNDIKIYLNSEDGFVASTDYENHEYDTIYKYYDDNSNNLGMLFIGSYVADTRIKLNEEYTKDQTALYYAVNVYNSTTDGLGIRIRKFNHNAVISRTLSSSDTKTLEKNGLSPYTVLPSTVANLDPDAKVTVANDFYEVAVYDPSINEAVSFFNIGLQTSRGDMEVSEVNDLLSMIHLHLPDDMSDLELDYYGIENITGNDYKWHDSTTYEMNQVVYVENGGTKTIYRSKYDGENTGHRPVGGEGDNYWQLVNTPSQIYVDLAIGSDDLDIIKISDSDLKRALDLIVLDEVYTTEGLCDLGNTDTNFQNYMANIAVNDNYFYPISTVMSTNYMVIGNSASKISQDSYKLYMSSPWDIDTGTLGWKFYAAPSVLYWETVAKNRRNNREFAPMFGQDNGTMQYQRPFTEFNKKTRQLLLSRKINTVMWDTTLQAWVMNDNYTKQIENTIMNDEGNSRLMIRISKAMPIILKQFLGKRISEKLCDSIRGVVDYFFKTNILTMDYSIDSYLITCNYDEALARQNKVRVKVEVKYQRALKYIEVFNEAIEVGMDFEG